MQVVEDEHDRAVPRGGREESRHRLEEAEACTFRLEPRRLGKVGEESLQLGQQRDEIGSTVAELCPELPGSTPRVYVRSACTQGQ